MSRNAKHVEVLKRVRDMTPEMDNERFHALNAAIRELDDYQGWTNRETWATYLHIGNNEWMYEHRREMLAGIRKSKNTSWSDVSNKFIWTDEDYVRFTYADQLKDWVEELFEEFYELINTSDEIGRMMRNVGSLWRVEWQEIADSWISDDPAPVAEPEPSEE